MAQIRFRWVDDIDIDDSWMTEEDRQLAHTWEGCLLERRCEHCGSWIVVDSLWGIVDASEDYRTRIEDDLLLGAGLSRPRLPASEPAPDEPCCDSGSVQFPS